MALITDPDLLNDGPTDNGSTEVYINTSSKTIKLNTTGNLSTDGVTLKCLYSFLKEEWRTDPHTKNLAAFPFPMTPITDESFAHAFSIGSGVSVDISILALGYQNQRILSYSTTSDATVPISQVLDRQYANA